VTCSRSVVSLGTPISSTNKTDRHDIAEILLKVTLNIIAIVLTKYIGDILVSVLAMSAADSGFELRRNPTKDYIICICSFSAKHTVLRRKS
jgi:hypothetical protein